MATSTSPGMKCKPPKFNFDVAVKTFFAQLEDYFSYAGIASDDDKIAIFKTNLSGPAYEQFVFGKNLPSTFTKLKSHVLSLHDPEERDFVYLDRLMAAAQMPQEPLRLYVDRLDSLAAKAYPSLSSTDRQRLVQGQLQRSLREPRLREEALLAAGKTFTDLVEHLTTVETVLRVRGGGADGVNAVQEERMSTLTATVEKLSQQMEKLAEAMAGQQQVTPRESRQCFNCGRTGHIARFCRGPRASCELCKMGHLTRFCRKKQQVCCAGLGESQGVLYESCRFTGVLVKVGDVSLVAMVDTGATPSLLSKNLWATLGGPELEAEGKSFVSADGSGLRVMGSTTLRVSIGGQGLEGRFSVVDGLNVDCLLGSQFLKQHDCVVDFSEEVLRVGTGETVQLLVQDSPTRTVATCVADTILEPYSEAIVTARPVGSLKDSPCLLITESLTRGKLQDRAPGWIVPREECEVPVRIVNDSPVTRTVKAGECVASVETVQYETRPATTEVTAEKERKIEAVVELAPLALEHKAVFKELLLDYHDVLAFSKEELGRTELAEHRIPTGSAAPVSLPCRRLPAVYKEEVERQLEWMVSNDLIRPSSSAWSAPIVVVKKKDGSLRLCCDYRRLNSVTAKDSYPMPRIDDTLEALAGSCVFSTLDLVSGYHQVPVAESDKEKTAFVTHKGLFQFNRLPFGLCGASATFQRLMTRALGELLDGICLVYVDDIICHTSGFDAHLGALRQVFEKLRQAGLTLRVDKCRFFETNVTFLGHIISEEGIRTDPEKVRTVHEWPVPTSQTELRGFLGLAGYYRKFVKGYATIATPLNKLLSKTEFRWSKEAQEAFDALKLRLTNSPVLAFPDCSSEAGVFILDTDASNHAMGAVLSQVTDGEERVVAYASKAFSKSEKNYCTTKKELLAVVHFARLFRPYLLGRHFIVRTDHASLQWLRNLRDVEGQLARWVMSLQEFDFQVQHRPGTRHGNADALSRRRHFGDSDCPACHDPGEGGPVATVTETPIAEAQSMDHDLQVIRVSVEEARPMSNDERNDLSSFGLEVAARKSELEVRQGVLGCRRRQGWLPIVPADKVQSIVKEAHEGLGGGHFGVTKTKVKVSERFWWPGFEEDVRAYVAGCPVCAASKNPLAWPRAALHPIKVSRPNQIVAMDVIGPLRRTSAGNAYGLVMIDLFTKWVEVAAIPDQTADTVVKAVQREWVASHGVPERFLTDQGTNFESATFAEYCRRLGVTRSHSSPYHAQGNGQVERMNRSLKMLLRLHIENEQDWDDQLPCCLMAYRASRQEGTGFSPYQLVYGSQMRLPMDNVVGERDEEVSHGALYLMLRERLRILHGAAKGNTERQKTAQKRVFDRRARPQSFEVGEPVWLYRPTWSGKGKLGRPWVGPYRVLEVLGPCNYRLRFWGRESGGTLVVHHNQLKRCEDVERAIRHSRGAPCEAVGVGLNERAESVMSDDSDSDVCALPAVSATSSSDDTSDTDDTLPMIDSSACRVPTPSRIPGPAHRYTLRPRLRRREEISCVLPGGRLPLRGGWCNNAEF